MWQRQGAISGECREPDARNAEPVSRRGGCFARSRRLKELGRVKLIDGDDADAGQLFVEGVHVVLKVEGLQPLPGQLNESLVAKLDESGDADPPAVEELTHMIDEVSVAPFGRPLSAQSQRYSGGISRIFSGSRGRNRSCCAHEGTDVFAHAFLLLGFPLGDATSC